jgi:hypothetical protein
MATKVDAESLEYIFHPRSVAIIGFASNPAYPKPLGDVSSSENIFPEKFDQYYLGELDRLTDAASGIGKAGALEFAKAGHKVPLVDCNEERLEKIIIEDFSPTGGDHVY